MNDTRRGPIWQWDATAVTAAIRSREITCSEAIDSVVGRMQTANPAVNAVTVDTQREALAEAAAADAALSAGAPVRALEGVAVTIKENVDQVGHSTPNGLGALAGSTVSEDSPVVKNLRQAGAIIVGRTNTPEFSLRFFTDNPLRGLTINPWETGVTCGGSSGGAAVAVALGMGAIAHGNDLAGSLRYPAHCCGVASIRPTTGRVPAFNPSQRAERAPLIQLMSVQGPIARSVRDARHALKVMARRDLRDPGWAPVPLDGDLTATPLRVAVTYGPPDRERDPSVTAAIESAAAQLATAGYRVEHRDPPALQEIERLRARLLGIELQVTLGQAVRAMGSSDLQSIFDHYVALGKDLGLAEYMQGLAQRTFLLRRWLQFLEDWPLVLAPVSLRAPFPVGEDARGSERLDAVLNAQAMLGIVNFLGLPALAVPTGLIGGVPTGVQIIGRPFREDQCFDAGQAIEDALGRLTPSLWSR